MVIGSGLRLRWRTRYLSSFPDTNKQNEDRQGETDRGRQTGEDRQGETGRQTGEDRQGKTDRGRQTGGDRLIEVRQTGRLTGTPGIKRPRLLLQFEPDVDKVLNVISLLWTEE